MQQRLQRQWLCLPASVGYGVSAQAELLVFNSNFVSSNDTVRTEWLAAVGIDAADYFVDFESGFVAEQNISGITGLFPAGLIIADTGGSDEVIIRTGNGVIGGSNPVGLFSATHDERPFLVLDFSASPVDYLGLLEIDQAGTTVVVTFEGGDSTSFRIETTASSGNTAEFLGIFRNDQPPIVRVELDASGDNRWGIDNLEYGPYRGFKDGFEPAPSVGGGDDDA